jgi:isocitrate dehydrogenase
VHNAWLRTIEDGIHTADIYEEGKSKRLVGTAAFADAIIERLGIQPGTLKPVAYRDSDKAFNAPVAKPVKRAQKDLVGIDVFVHWDGQNPDELAETMKKAANGSYELAMITNRGVKVWPHGLPETFKTDHWRCRYMAKGGKQLNKAMIAELMSRLAQQGTDFIKTEHLYTFDGEPGYSLGQGQ